tara:strand:+ start:251 stop:1540 length:1290 start_codon:yes stop_codon:yes gene_type:complete
MANSDYFPTPEIITEEAFKKAENQLLPKHRRELKQIREQQWPNEKQLPNKKMNSNQKTKIDELLATISGLNLNIIRLEKKNAGLNNLLKMISEVNKINSKDLEGVLKSELMQSKNKIRELEIQLSQDRINDNKNFPNQLKNENIRLKEKNIHLQGENSLLQGENIRLEGENIRLQEENNRLKEQSRGENSVSSFIKKPYIRNGVMDEENNRLKGENIRLQEKNIRLQGENNRLQEAYINELKKTGSVSSIWRSVKKLVKPGFDSGSKYYNMTEKEIMLDVARILTEIKITRSHWNRFEKFFNYKYGLYKYGLNVEYNIDTQTFDTQTFTGNDEEIFKKMYNEFTTDKRIKIYHPNNTKKEIENGSRFETNLDRRLGEDVYRFGRGARRTKKKVAKSLSNSMKKAKNMFRNITRKRQNSKMILAPNEVFI